VDKDFTRNYSVLEKLNLSRFKEGQYLMLIDGKIVKKGWVINKMIESVRKKYPEKTPLIFRVQPKQISSM